MKTRQLLQEIKGVFKPPKKRYYIGKLQYGSPYFYPMYFNKNIISVRKLILTPESKYQEIIKEHPFYKEAKRFTNLPMCRRSKDWIFKLFNNWYWLEIGWPISVKNIELGWKDKYNSPRFEWPPSFQIYFFHWQFCIFYKAPDGDDDKYYEMILWWLHYSDKDIKKAESTWKWINYETKLSTWNKDYLICKN